MYLLWSCLGEPNAGQLLLPGLMLTPSFCKHYIPLLTMVADISLLQQLGQVLCIRRGLNIASFALKQQALLHILRVSEPTTTWCQ